MERERENRRRRRRSALFAPAFVRSSSFFSRWWWWCSGQFFLFLSVFFYCYIIKERRKKDRQFFEGRKDVLVGGTVRIEQRTSYVLFFFFLFFFFSTATSPPFFLRLCFFSDVHNGVYKTAMCIFPRFLPLILPSCSCRKKHWKMSCITNSIHRLFPARLCSIVRRRRRELLMNLPCYFCLQHSFFPLRTKTVDKRSKTKKDEK